MGWAAGRVLVIFGGMHSLNPELKAGRGRACISSGKHFSSQSCSSAKNLHANENLQVVVKTQSVSLVGGEQNSVGQRCRCCLACSLGAHVSAHFPWVLGSSGSLLVACPGLHHNKQ